MHIATDVIAQIGCAAEMGIGVEQRTAFFTDDHFQPYQEAAFAFSNTAVSKHNL